MEGHRMKEVSELLKKMQEEAYRRGYEDGYDKGCMDMTDEDIGSDIEEGSWEE